MRKITLFTTMLVLLVAVVLLAACSGGEPETTVVQVKLNEYSIIMDETSIPAGTVRFEIENAGTEEHEVVLEPAGADDEPFELNGVESEAEDIGPGDTATLEWTIDEAGAYQLACYVEDHFDKGMVTEFSVTAAK